MTDRRRVDWDGQFTDTAPPTVRSGRRSLELTSLLSALDTMIALDDVDAILRYAVETARERIGLVRTSIFLRDEASGLMCGAWGTDIQGKTVDEHYITFDIQPGDREYYRDLARDGVFWTVTENAPHVVHTPTETRVVGRGWVCSTPIRSDSELWGLMFNDPGLTGAAIDDGRQSRMAVLCSLVGTALDRARRRRQSPNDVGTAPQSRIVTKAVELLGRNPAMTGEDLGAKLHLSASRVARLLKAEMGISLVAYRNRLRLDRFSMLLDRQGTNLLEAALAAGFGSYAQFHRVFLTEHGTTPGKFLRTRARRQK